VFGLYNGLWYDRRFLPRNSDWGSIYRHTLRGDDGKVLRTRDTGKMM
jgi:hypothetical protein